MPASPERTATHAASVFKRKTLKYGSSITVAGQSCKAFPASVERGDAAYLPDGASGNAAFPDLRAYLIAPDALAAPVQAGQAVQDQGRAFTVIAVPPAERVADVPIYQKFFAYQQSAPDAASDAPAGETGAGTRKEYYPPASTL